MGVFFAFLIKKKVNKIYQWKIFGISIQEEIIYMTTPQHNIVYNLVSLRHDILVYLFKSHDFSILNVIPNIG